MLALHVDKAVRLRQSSSAQAEQFAGRVIDTSVYEQGFGDLTKDGKGDLLMQ